MIFKGKYTEVKDHSPIPIIKLQIKNLDSSSYFSEKEGIMDTGADCTLIPFSIISQIQSKNLIRGRQKKIVYGIGTQKIITVPYRVLISFNHQDFIKIKVYACPDHETNGFIIIGRNFLNRYCITFDGKNRFFEIR
jgi:hypothetical protein